MPELPPDDIRKTAAGVAKNALMEADACHCGDCVGLASGPIARALMAERERCAELAANMLDRGGISTAIRAGRKH